MNNIDQQLLAFALGFGFVGWVMVLVAVLK